MILSISKVRSALPEEWDAIWQACEYSTYFQSREWAELWSAYTQGQVRPTPKLIVFSDGKTALLPLSTLNRGFLKEYILSYAATFGGWLSSDRLELDHANLLRKYLVKKLCFNLTHTLTWRINPYDDLALKAISAVSTEEDTHSIHLTPGFEAIYKKTSRGHRSAEKKARSQGLVVKVASSLEEWQQYYEAYQSSIARWGEKCAGELSWNALQQMYEKDSPNIKLWVVTYQGKVVSGALCLYSKNHVIYWHGASHEDYMHLRPATLLMYEIIKHSCESGYSWFDFNPSAGLEGVRTFKERFGAESLRCPMIVINQEMKFKVLTRNMLGLAGIKVGGAGLAICD